MKWLFPLLILSSCSIVTTDQVGNLDIVDDSRAINNASHTLKLFKRNSRSKRSAPMVSYGPTKRCTDTIRLPQILQALYDLIKLMLLGPIISQTVPTITAANLPWTPVSMPTNLPVPTSMAPQSSSSAASASPTASVLLIWDVPPVSGQPFYSFYNVAVDFKDNLDTQCGSKVPAIPIIWELDDPKHKRVDDIRSKGQSLGPQQRVPPGTIGPIPKFNGNCNYVEDDLGKGKLQCNGSEVDCHPPDDSLVQNVTPFNGRCGTTQNVRMLVMVCPYR